MLNVLNVCADYIGQGEGIPSKLAFMIAIIIRIIQIGVPVLLIIWGMLDLGKAVMAQKEDEIKKGQNTFIKRVIAAAIVFFIITIVNLVVGLVADDSKGLLKCIDSIISCNDSNCNDKE